MNVTPALTHMGISTSLVQAVQETREYITRNNGDESDASQLIHALLDIFVDSKEFRREGADPITWAVTVAQAVVEAIIKADCVVDDAQALLTGAWERADKFINKPSGRWMFAVAEEAAPVNGEFTQVSTTVDTQVVVKADGKIKKGGKETMAIALYEKFKADKAARNEPDLATDNQAFVAILVKELGMTKAGAQTYNYNMKKKLGGVIVAKKRK